MCHLSDGQRDAYPLNDRKITSQRCPPSDKQSRGSLQTQANMTRWPHTFLLHAPTRRSCPPPTRRVAARSVSAQIGGCRRENQRRPRRWARLPAGGPSGGCQREKTTVRLPFMRTRCSAWKRTAWARTRRSTSCPSATMSGVESAWETRVTSCSMIGPSSRSAVT